MKITYGNEATMSYRVGSRDIRLGYEARGKYRVVYRSDHGVVTRLGTVRRQSDREWHAMGRIFGSLHEAMETMAEDK